MINPQPGEEGRGVLYYSHGALPELGRISSWTDKYVFVRYHLGDTAAATLREDLKWFSEAPSGTNYRDRTLGRVLIK